MSKRLISILEAAELGVQRLRKPVWANPLDHLQIDIVDGRPGPWLHIWCPFNKECNGRDPVDMIAYTQNLGMREFEPYAGPLPDSEEYRKAVEQFDGVLAKEEKRNGD
jgi:hypothetical protein